MAIVMLVSLYASRKVLNVLGVEDFGIYNVVSGIVILFSFMNAAMTNASQRYLSFALGKEDRRELLKVFSTSIFLHFAIILLLVVLTETLGLWYVREKLSIPEGKYTQAVITYHLAILATCINIIRVPFQATIISYEHMSKYAIISIVESVLKLLSVCLLPIIPGNKLLLYSLLIIIINLIILTIYICICVLDYRLKLIYVSDGRLIKEFISFSGWNMLGGIADVTYQQGTNLIINSFYGVTVNAAVGIMNQVRTAVYSFVSNLQLAANPQIIKSYSNQDYNYFLSLISLVSRLSYYMMLALAIPLIINMDYILTIWLKTVPNYSSVFCRLILIYCLIDSLSGPLWVSIQATGNMKYYQIFISTILILNLPLSQAALHYGFAPEVVYIIQIILCVVALVVRVILAHKYINMNVMYYIKEVLLRIIAVTILSSSFSLLFINLCDGFWKLLLTFFINLVSLLCAVYFIGINNAERARIRLYINKS